MLRRAVGATEAAVKRFLLIVGVGALAFQLVGILQEWDYFSSSWFGPSVSKHEVPQAVRAQLEETIKTYLALSRHLYASAADPRFVERIPASRSVVDELLADVAFLQHSHINEQRNLLGLSIKQVRLDGDRRAVVRTREYWVTRRFDASGANTETRSDVVEVNYTLARDAGHWRVEGWTFVEPQETDDPEHP